MNRFWLLIVLLFSGAALPSSAAGLSEDKVSRLFDSLPDMVIHAMAGRWDPAMMQVGPQGDARSGQAPFTSIVIALARQGRLDDDVRRTLCDHGFVSPEEWAQTGDLLFRAHLAANHMPAADIANEGLAAARKTVEDEDLPPDVKAQLLATLGGGADVHELYDVTGADIALARRHAERIASTGVAWGAYWLWKVEPPRAGQAYVFSQARQCGMSLPELTKGMFRWVGGQLIWQPPRGYVRQAPDYAVGIRG